MCVCVFAELEMVELKAQDYDEAKGKLQKTLDQERIMKVEAVNKLAQVCEGG